MDSKLSASPFSSDIKKKIKRNYFKFDVALKSYKCDFTSPDISTRAKLYISSSALHIVHRPKRRKLTTIPFSGVSTIDASTDKKCVNITISNGMVYMLHRFERADSAVGFIINFWNMVRKEKLLSKQESVSLNKADNKSGSIERFSTTSSDVCAPFSGSLSMLKAPTTISLNSSPSMSEPESLDSRKFMSSAKTSVCSRSSEPAVQRLPSPATCSSSDLRERSRKSSVASTSATSKCLPPAVLVPENSNSSIHTSLSSPTFSRVPRSTPSVVEQNIPSNNTKQSTGFNVVPSHTGPFDFQRVVPGLTKASSWIVWSLNLLPVPLFSSPQRFTMSIAYVILGFLIFSTLYLYHRIAVFDFHGTRIRDMSRSITSPPSTSDVHARLRSLQSDLSQMVSLAEQLTHSLLQLTTELQHSAATSFSTQPDGSPAAAAT